jgi:diguanylate cyclase (GGDEF)-like protein
VNDAPNTPKRSWLCPAESDRSRQRDISRRILPATTMLAVISVPVTVLLVRRVGVVLLAPYALAAGAAVALDMLSRSTLRVEYWIFASDLLALGAIAAGVALTGGSDSPILGFFAFSLVVGVSRYTGRGLLAFGAAVAASATLACARAVNRGVDYSDLRLLGFVTCIVGLSLLVAALARAERDYHRQSLVDPLTGLLNRLALIRRLEEMRAQAGGADDRLCVIAADLDYFKTVNDEHGHDVGDAVLEGVAATLRSNLRTFPMLYRTGGEEFIAILPGLSSDEGKGVAERLRSAVADVEPQGLRVTMSFGVATAHGPDLDLDEVLACADRHLYRAKRSGRNRVVGAVDVGPRLGVTGVGWGARTEEPRLLEAG